MFSNYQYTKENLKNIADTWLILNKEERKKSFDELLSNPKSCMTHTKQLCSLWASISLMHIFLDDAINNAYHVDDL